MKACILSLLYISMVAASLKSEASRELGGETELKSAGTDGVDTNSKLHYWMTPALISGYLTFFFLLFICYNAFLLLGAIQSPSYQVEGPKKDDKEAGKNQFEHIWGNLEI